MIASVGDSPVRGKFAAGDSPRQTCRQRRKGLLGGRLEYGRMRDREDCLFCGIAQRKIPGEILHEDEELVAFKDAYPKAPVHFLIAPRKHLEDHLALQEQDSRLMAQAHLLANRLAKDFRIDDGFRIIVNCREKAGQTVNHLHMHVMGGRDFHWPPG